MKIGLIDVDSHNFPNLALMKISAYHKKIGDIVKWYAMPSNDEDEYDIVYCSRVFDDTYSADYPAKIFAKEIIYGGTGYDIKSTLPTYIEHIYPDYELYPQYHFALGFLTRGCPNQCPFCIVSRKEGKISRKVADLKDFYDNQREIKLLDPNILMCKDRISLLKQLSESNAWVDFTQGLDARAISDDVCNILRHIKIKNVHFAFDLMKNEKQVLRGLELYREKVGIPNNNGVYILTNFNTTHDEDMYRVRKVQELGYLPYIMVFDKPNAPQITRDLQRWCNSRMIYKSTGGDFSNYKTTCKKINSQMSMFM